MQFTLEDEVKFDQYLDKLMDEGTLLKTVAECFMVTEVFELSDIRESACEEFDINDIYSYDEILDNARDTFSIDEIFGDEYIHVEGIGEQPPTYWYSSEYLWEWAEDYVGEGLEERFMDYLKNDDHYDDMIEDKIKSGDLDDRLEALGWVKQENEDE